MKPWFFLSLVCLSWAAWSQESLLRYGLFIGANQGGPGRETLKYASADAQALAGVMQEIGGFAPGDISRLTDPDPAGILGALGDLTSKISQAHTRGQRVEFLFYYSGHSDETGLLLGRQVLPWTRLRDTLGAMGADVRMAVLDSCASRSFTRIKGGTKAAPFLVDESSDLKGHAYLTSSSEDEASQESDRIGGSFFTHYLITGLRGAADSTGDGKVTLNEVYHHAFSETLARTENTRAGPQHASYDIQLSGTGDLVLTDLNQRTARLTLGAEIEGRVFIRNSRGQLAAELEKVRGSPVTLGLGPGSYSISVQTSGTYQTATMSLEQGRVHNLGPDKLRSGELERNRTRGIEEPEPAAAGKETEEDYTFTFSLPKLPYMGWLPFFDPMDPARFQLPSLLLEFPVNLGLFPGAELYPGYNKAVSLSLHALVSQSAQTQGFQAGGLLSLSGSLEGAQVGGLGSLTTGPVTGFQTGGLFSLATDKVTGFQSAGLFNIAGSGLSGLQTSAIFNISAGPMSGLQAAGVFNGADQVNGVQAGLINRAGRVRGLQVGLINISEKMEGFSLGLVTIAGNGLYRLEASSDTLGYLWTTARWGVPGAYASVFYGAPMGPEWQGTAGGLRGFALGRQWGDVFWGDVEAGAVFLPDESGENILGGGFYPLVKTALGVKIGLLQIRAGGGVNFHLEGWSTPHALNEGNSIIIPGTERHLRSRPWGSLGISFGL